MGLLDQISLRPRGAGLQNALIGLAAGIGGSVGKEGFGLGEGLRGFAQGRQLDINQAEQGERRAAAAELLQDSEAFGTLSPAERRLVATDPTLASRLVLSEREGEIRQKIADATRAANRTQLVQINGQTFQRKGDGTLVAVPMTLEQRKELAAAGKTDIGIDLGAKKGAGKLGERLADGLITATDKAQGATGRMAQMAVLESQLADPNLFQGKAGGAINFAKQVGTDLFGLDIKGAAAGEVADRISKEFALKLTSEIDVGKMSDGDRNFLLTLPPSITTSPEGNRRLIAFRRFQDRHIINKAAVWRDAIREDGSVDPRVLNDLARLDADHLKGVAGLTKDMRDFAKQAKRKNPFVGIPISSMNRSQLEKFVASRGGASRLTTEQAREIEQRLDALEGGPRGR